MMLILYYAEELKRDVINGVAAQMRWRGHSAALPAGGEGPSQEGKKQKRIVGQHGNQLLVPARTFQEFIKHGMSIVVVGPVEAPIAAPKSISALSTNTHSSRASSLNYCRST